MTTVIVIDPLPRHLIPEESSRLPRWTRYGLVYGQLYSGPPPLYPPPIARTIIP